MPRRRPLSLRTLLLSAALAAFPIAPACADGVSVVVSVAPAHSLAMMAAGGRADVALLVPPDASPHNFAMKPSAARALSSADIVISVGAGLDGFLDAPIEALGDKALILRLSEAPGVSLLPIRTEALWSADNGEVGHDHHAEGGHSAEDHARHMADPAHRAEHERRHGSEDDHDGHGHGHHSGAIDPHIWLAPANARAWLKAIAAKLAEADPAGAEVYAANAAEADARLAKMEARLGLRLSPVATRPFAVFHDAYQYLERRYGLTALGAIAGVDGAAPSPLRLRDIQGAIRESGAVCVFSEPQLDPRLVAVVAEGTDAKGAVLDPLGAKIPPGPDHYISMMDALADGLAKCLE